LFPFLVSTFKFLHPNDVGVRILSFKSQSIKTIKTIYDFMEIDEEMTSSMVKE
jgi:hypothetical protein